MKAVVIVGVLSVSFRGVSIVVSLGINCWGCVRVEAQVVGTYDVRVFVFALNQRRRWR